MQPKSRPISPSPGLGEVLPTAALIDGQVDRIARGACRDHIAAECAPLPFQCPDVVESLVDQAPILICGYREDCAFAVGGCFDHADRAVEFDLRHRLTVDLGSIAGQRQRQFGDPAGKLVAVGDDQQSQAGLRSASMVVSRASMVAVCWPIRLIAAAANRIFVGLVDSHVECRRERHREHAEALTSLCPRGYLHRGFGLDDEGDVVPRRVTSVGQVADVQCQTDIGLDGIGRDAEGDVQVARAVQRPGSPPPTRPGPPPSPPLVNGV